MKQTQSIAKKLDVFFHVLQIAMRIAIVGCLVGLGILAAGTIFQLDPDTIGTGYTSLELGFMEFELSESASPEKHQVLMIVGTNIVMALVTAVGADYGVRQIRDILVPMKEGQPFNKTVSDNLKKLAYLCLILGIIVNVISGINLALIMNTFDVVNLFVSDAITHVTVNFNFDFTFIAVSAILMLLSYIFQYGEELQTLSDETL